eukprot:gene8137-11016_t
MTNNCKKVALIGSSGGGNANLSLSGQELKINIDYYLQFINNNNSLDEEEIRLVGGANLSFMVYVESNVGMDFIEDYDQTTARLWIMNEFEDKLNKHATNSKFYSVNGSLKEINLLLKKQDNILAELIKNNQIDGIISISSDPNQMNYNTIQASILKNIPIIGTGGQSISQISIQGGNVIGNSGGSVATSAKSRSLCFATSLASYWKLTFTPNYIHYPKLSSIIGASLPFLFIFDCFLGGLCGYLISWGSENGYYHTIILPIIAFEMQNGEFGLFGAYDIICLCMPCAG